MFSRLSRLPLRRSLHTGPGAARSAGAFGRPARVALGVSAATAAYLTWQLTRERNQISLDSPQASRSSERSLTTKTSRLPEAPSEPTLSSASTSTAESDVFVPDVPSDSEDVPEPPSENGAAEGEGESSSEEGGASGGAFNPVTGEINWDCPCLGGMAHGPCGPEFREAFSCFVFSEAEPKGINCVEKFQNMQNCFRAHPDVYADEIMNDDDDEEVPANDGSNDLPPPEHSTDDKLNGDVTPSTQKPQLDAAPIPGDS